MVEDDDDGFYLRGREAIYLVENSAGTIRLGFLRGKNLEVRNICLCFPGEGPRKWQYVSSLSYEELSSSTLSLASRTLRAPTDHSKARVCKDCT